MRNAIYFQNELRRRYPEEYQRLCAEIEARNGLIAPDIAFARSSSNPVDRRLDFCAYFLATIQALEKHGESVERIREICLAVTLEYVRPKNAWQSWLKRLPARLLGTWIQRMFVPIMRSKAGKKGHRDGFLVQIVTDPEQTHGLGFGIDIVECGVVKLFQKHGAAHYVPILCEVDEYTSAMAGLQLFRGGTLAGGAARCDFRFRREG
jgi:hypothetical protein